MDSLSFLSGPMTHTARALAGRPLLQIEGKEYDALTDYFIVFSRCALFNTRDLFLLKVFFQFKLQKRVPRLFC